MKDYRINPDAKHSGRIFEGLMAKGGYCPCKIPKIPENLCPCDEFIETKECHCKLWVKIEEEE